MSFESRRNFLKTSGTLLVGTTALAALAAQAGDEHAHAHGGAGDGHAISASTENTCATCEFWGGMRKLSQDKSEVIAQSMGWCNNPESPNHAKLTAPDHLMAKSGIWKKWGAI
jgi:anaerobic selenocysteine-containing dehydrogenase